MPVPIAIIFGQTAIGKTELLSDLFSLVSPLSLLAGCAEIVNADSVQVYALARVCAASPPPHILKHLRHHLVGGKTPFEEFSVSDFVNEADRIVPSIYKEKKLPVLAGGAGFFIKNFIYGLPNTPKSNTITRESLQKRLEAEGIQSLYRELEKIDPTTSKNLKLNDEYRILRALEVYYDSGKPLSSYTINEKVRDKYNFLIVSLKREREELYRRIEHRVDEMGKALHDEFLYIYDYCKKMIEKVDFETVPLFKSIGYREFFEVNSLFPEKATFDEVLTLIKRDTKRYAKRQETFFKTISPKIEIDMDSHDWYRMLHAILVQFYEENIEV